MNRTTGSAPRGAHAISVFEHDGIDCAITRENGHYHGYVRLPGSLLPEALDGLEVHGGLIYGPDDDGWIGFSSEPLTPSELGFFNVGYTRPSLVGRWSFPKTHIETVRLASQLTGSLAALSSPTLTVAL